MTHLSDEQLKALELKANDPGEIATHLTGREALKQHTS